MTAARGRAREEHVRARADVVAVRPPDRVDARASCETKFAKRPEIAAANLKAFNTGYAFGETSEALRGPVRGEAGAARAGPLPPDHRQLGALVRADRRVEALAGSTLFLGAYPITPASSILEELAKHKAFGVRTFQAEDEIAAVGAALGAAFGGALGVTTSAGPGIVLKSETVGLAVDARAAAADHRRAARRPVDRHADEAGAGRPADGALRAQLRVAGAGDRAVDAGRLLLRRDRGGARRAHLPHAGLPAFATRTSRTAPSRGRSPTSRRWSRSRSSSRRRSKARRSCPTSATRRRSRGRGRFPARRGSSTASAGSRRRTRPATSPTTPTTTT